MTEHAPLVIFSFIVSAVVFLSMLILVPLAIIHLPADYFCRASSNKQRSILWVAGKNVLGVVLALLGVAMLVLPGQGILTLIAGLSLIDFPGRQRLVHKLLERPAVRRGMGAIRRRAGKPALQWPTADKH